MNSDTRCPPADSPFRFAGVGMAPPRRQCLGGCGQFRLTAGGRGIGIRWRCAECVAKREAMKEAA